MRKIRSKTKKSKMEIIIIMIIILFFCTISIGYSYLKQSLKISGKSTIVQKNILDEYEKGNSTYNWKINSFSKDEQGNYVYNINLNIVNLDNDIMKWEIGFDVPKSYNKEKTNISDSSITLYENGRLILKSQDWNEYIAKGDSLILNFEIAFTQEENDFISNLTLNNLLLSYK